MNIHQHESLSDHRALALLFALSDIKNGETRRLTDRCLNSGHVRDGFAVVLGGRLGGDR